MVKPERARAWSLGAARRAPPDTIINIPAVPIVAFITIILVIVSSPSFGGFLFC
jgi:hypothetical protein